MVDTVLACPNPKCGKRLDANHSDPWCHECGEHFPDEFQGQVPRLAAVAARKQQLQSAPPPTTAGPPSTLVSRYDDAYLVARTVNGTGQTIKSLGIILGLLLAVAGFYAAQRLGTELAIAALLFGAAAGLPVFVLGVLIATQGQILKATLDTAVNSSPLLSHDQIRNILKA